MTQRIYQWSSNPREAQQQQGLQMEPPKSNSHHREKIPSRCKYIFHVKQKSLDPKWTLT